MTTSFTMYVAKADGAEEIVARGVSAARALNTALEYGGAGRTVLAADIGIAHILWELLRSGPGGRRERVMEALTVRTSDYLSDARDDYAELGEVFLGNIRAYRQGGFERDDEYDRRYADPESAS